MDPSEQDNFSLFVRKLRSVVDNIRISDERFQFVGCFVLNWGKTDKERSRQW